MVVVLELRETRWKVVVLDKRQEAVQGQGVMRRKLFEVNGGVGSGAAGDSSRWKVAVLDKEAGVREAVQGG